ncbi:MAG: alpha/beta hydrolase [Paracoccaceae bacterium]
MPSLFASYPDGVSAQDINADGVQVRSYRRVKRQTGVTLPYGHGGSLMLGGLDRHDDVCAAICDATGYDVIVVDYRLMPDFTRQDALDDFQTALDCLRRDRVGSFICVGDSAGGFLSARTVQANHAAGDIFGQVLIYPGLALYNAGCSMDEHTFAPLLIRADDARDYAAAINDAGGQAFWCEDTGLVPSHLRAHLTVKRARASFDRVLWAIRLIGSVHPVTRADIENCPWLFLCKNTRAAGSDISPDCCSVNSRLCSGYHRHPDTGRQPYTFGKPDAHFRLFDNVLRTSWHCGPHLDLSLPLCSFSVTPFLPISGPKPAFSTAWRRNRQDQCRAWSLRPSGNTVGYAGQGWETNYGRGYSVQNAKTRCEPAKRTSG